MGMIVARITRGADFHKKTISPYLYAAALMGMFTFLFLGAEYLFVNVLSGVVSEDKTVLAQNYALGISAAGFVLYPLSGRFRKDRLKAVCAVFGCLLSVLCMGFICSGTAYAGIFAAGLVLFLLLGGVGSAVFYASVRMMKTDRYLARTVGVSYGAGVLLQFVNNNLIRSGIAEAAMLSVCLLILIALLMKCRRDSCERRETPADPPAKEKQSGGKEEKMGPVVGGLCVLLVALMTCIFSTLDNVVTLAHSRGEMDIGQWPRILLALSGVAAGFVFDLNNRKYTGFIMYCVMVLSTICIAVLEFSGSFLVGLVVFYLSAGFFAVFFTSGSMEISRHRKMPELWAGMGRAVNNITAAVIAKPVLGLMSSDSTLAVIVLVLVLFAAVSVVAAVYTFRKKTFFEQLVSAATEERDEKEKLRNFAEVFSFTERETEVFDRLVNTEDSIQAIAEGLYISRRTLERYISAIYEKTGVRSRIGLLKLYNK